jgi:hypothetical protein
MSHDIAELQNCRIAGLQKGLQDCRIAERIERSRRSDLSAFLPAILQSCNSAICWSYSREYQNSRMKPMAMSIVIGMNGDWAQMFP